MTLFSRGSIVAAVQIRTCFATPSLSQHHARVLRSRASPIIFQWQHSFGRCSYSTRDKVELPKPSQEQSNKEKSQDSNLQDRLQDTEERLIEDDYAVLREKYGTLARCET